MTLEKLREIAKKATVGKWTVDPHHTADVVGPDKIDIACCRLPGKHDRGWDASAANAEHIATFSPDVVLSLLANAEALQGILSNVSLDWYAAQFRRDERPSGVSSGAPARIQNADTEARAKVAFAKAREALTKLKEAGVTI